MPFIRFGFVPSETKKTKINKIGTRKGEDEWPFIRVEKEMCNEKQIHLL